VRYLTSLAHRPINNGESIMALTDQDIRDYYKQQAENKRNGGEWRDTPEVDHYIKRCKDAGKHPSKRDNKKF